MSLEACPTCGYALSTLANQCRHCPAPMSVLPSSGAFNAKHLSKMIVIAVGLTVLVYLIFFR